MGGKSAKRVAKRGWQPMVECYTIRDGTGRERPVPEGERYFGNDLYSACLRRVEREVDCDDCAGRGIIDSGIASESSTPPFCESCDGHGRAIDTDAPARLHISYHRRDRKPARDWRHTQQIKNDIVGADAEMVEMYPAESRLVDTANEYHLWGFEGVPLLALGFNDGRIVDDGDLVDEYPGAKQRPLLRVDTSTRDV